MTPAPVFLATLATLPFATPVLAVPVPAAPPASEGEEYPAARARLVESAVPAAEDLAEWCSRNRLYAARDDTYAAILALDPDHVGARQGLRYLKRSEGWVQSDQYRRPENRDEDALPEYEERRRAVFAPVAEFGLAWLARGEGAVPVDEARELARLVSTVAPPDSPWRRRLDDAWDAERGSWRVEEPSDTAATGVALEGEPAPPTVVHPELALDLLLDALGVPLVVHDEPGPREGRWLGRLGPSDLDVSFVYVEDTDGTLAEAEDAAERFLYPRRSDGELFWPGFFLGSSERVADPSTGPLGASPYALLMRGPLRDVPGRNGPAEAWVLGGLLERGGWALLVEARPPLREEDAATLAAGLRRAVRYRGPARDPRWTDEEAYARWRAWAPEGLEDEMDEVVRTEHFIVLGNSSSGRNFGEKMEECYETIREMFPFEEVEGRRLLPVFLFRTREQYVEFLVKKAGRTTQQARRSGGVAWADLYATWYEAPGDPVHIHEATHQLFRNRLRLGGAGSWFQEGVAEYVETRANQRGGAAREVERRRHLPLREFFTVRSLLFSNEPDKKGSDVTGSQYKLAALLIEFLRESEFGEDRFLEFVNAVGKVPRNDVERIEAVIRRVYGCSVEELEDAWVDYCKRR